MFRTVELLRSMRGKIATGWTQGCSARNRQGNPVVPSSPEASQWCLIGSTVAYKPDDLGRDLKYRMSAYDILIQLIANRNEKPLVEDYNDTPGRTREEVLELLDEAISVASVGGYD